MSSWLRGEAHGHTGLVLLPKQYQLVSDIPYVIPPFPGELTLPHGVDPAKAVQRRDAHAEQIRLF